MDKVSKQRSPTGANIDQRRSNLSFQDSKNDNATSKRCNRLGCSTRYISSTVAESSDKGKLKSSTIFSPGKRSSTRSSPKCSSTISMRKSKEQKKLPSFQKRVVAESSNRREHTDEQESSGERLKMVEGTVLAVTRPGILCRISEDTDSDSVDEFSVDACGASESFSQSANLGSRKDSCRQTVTYNHDVPSRYPTLHVKRCQNSTQVTRTSVDCSTRNLTRKSTLDVASGSSSSSICGPNRRNSSLRKESPPTVEAFTSRGQARVNSSIRGSLALRSSNLDGQLPLSPSARTRNQPNSRYSAPAVRSERTDRETRTRLHLLGGSSNEPSVTNRESTTRRTGFANARTRPVAHPDHDDSREQLLLDRDLRRINIDGIAQLLLALEMIEQQEDLTDEHLIGLGYHDQHRDMRLDIDNMSYEELLALGEKMGTVSTALSEEELSKCLKQTTYGKLLKTACNSKDDAKCSICQEEYSVEDEVGILVCEHLYHVDCIHHWLRQKNWCPVCKASSAPSI